MSVVLMKGGRLALALLLCPATVWAQASAESQKLEKVQIQGEASVAAQRRESVGAKVIVSREDLLSQGDTRLADALQRMPGLTVVNNGSRGSEIRMSGLGGGYTQLLLNGEPVPPGFSLESISPELIERVEISRSASVEQSNQAIAGSINIVLRRAAIRKGQRELKLGVSQVFDRSSASGDLTLGDREGALSWGLGLGLASDGQVWPMALTQQVSDATGKPVQAYTTAKREFDRSERLTLAPRATWTISPTQSINTDHLLRFTKSFGGALDERESQLGTLPQYKHNDLFFHVRSHSLRSRLGWQAKQDDGSQWELKLGLTHQLRDSVADFTGHNFTERLIRDAQVTSTGIDRGLNLAGRWRRPLGEDHGLSLGWDAEETRRNEDRTQREKALPGGLPVENLDEIYDARVQRLALYAQDEWEISPQWSTVLGLRWEGLHTRSTGNVFEGVSSKVSVFSPVLQALWKLPASSDQIRMSLARSYKAPTPRELMPRRYVANSNSPATPDLQGNPNLLPELAWGLDLGWTHPLAGKAGQVAINAYAKRIDQVVVDELFQQNGSWVQRRRNLGTAQVSGLELEARLSLQQLMANAPALELRGNLGLNRSRVAAVPGPDNRLAQQTPLSLNLGFDHRVAGLPLTWGGNFSRQAGGPMRLAENRFSNKSAQRLLDTYALWKMDALTQWRFSLGNLLHPDQVEQRRIQVDGVDNRLEDRWRSSVLARLVYERKL